MKANFKFLGIIFIAVLFTTTMPPSSHGAQKLDPKKWVAGRLTHESGTVWIYDLKGYNPKKPSKKPIKIWVDGRPLMFTPQYQSSPMDTGGRFEFDSPYEKKKAIAGRIVLFSVNGTTRKFIKSQVASDGTVRMPGEPIGGTDAWQKLIKLGKEKKKEAPTWRANATLFAEAYQNRIGNRGLMDDFVKAAAYHLEYTYQPDSFQRFLADYLEEHTDFRDQLEEGAQKYLKLEWNHKEIDTINDVLELVDKSVKKWKKEKGIQKLLKTMGPHGKFVYMTKKQAPQSWAKNAESFRRSYTHLFDDPEIMNGFLDASVKHLKAKGPKRAAPFENFLHHYAKNHKGFASALEKAGKEIFLEEFDVKKLEDVKSLVAKTTERRIEIFGDDDQGFGRWKLNTDIRQLVKKQYPSWQRGIHFFNRLLAKRFSPENRDTFYTQAYKYLKEKGRKKSFDQYLMEYCSTHKKFKEHLVAGVKALLEKDVSFDNIVETRKAVNGVLAIRNEERLENYTANKPVREMRVEYEISVKQSNRESWKNNAVAFRRTFQRSFSSELYMDDFLRSAIAHLKSDKPKQAFQKFLREYVQTHTSFAKELEEAAEKYLGTNLGNIYEQKTINDLVSAVTAKFGNGS